MNVPSYVVEHAKDLKYLLPGKGNCIRRMHRDIFEFFFFSLYLSSIPYFIVNAVQFPSL